MESNFGRIWEQTTKSVQRGTAAEDLGRLYKPADIDGLNFIKWHGEDGQKMNDDQFNYAYPEYDKRLSDYIHQMKMERKNYWT